MRGVLKELPKDKKTKHVGILNFNRKEIRRWHHLLPGANHTVLSVERAGRDATWEALYPEWIDEEEDEQVPRCPSLPSLAPPKQRLDLIVVKLPCRREGKWSRDVPRLHLQIAAADLAASHKGSHQPYLLLATACFPTPNLFNCKDLVSRQGNAWLYRPDLGALREKLGLPIGSCQLALPIASIGTLKQLYTFGATFL